MDLIVTIGDTCLEMLPWVVGLAVVFGILVRIMPCNRGMYWGTDVRSAATDLLYMFLVPLFVRIVKTWLLAAAIVFAFHGADPGFGAIRGLPIWLQCGLILVLQDILLYWIHRAFHTRAAWPFHAVHHAPKLLDWASSARTHLVNHLLSFVMVDVLVLLLGFRPEALVAMAPFCLVHSCLVHANLNWTFGPLRYVIASPVFHRWHHVSEGDSVDKNFAPTFPILDIAFGTFYMPPGLVPETFGNGEPDYPEDFWGQLIRPFAISTSRDGLAAEQVVCRK